MSLLYGSPKYSSKPCLRGQEGLVIAQVPLADGRGRVADGLEQLGDGHLLRIEPGAAAGEKHVGQADPHGIAAGHERGSGRRTDGRGGIEAREPDAFGRQAIEMGCCEPLRAKRADVGVALIVCENDDDVGAAGQGLPSGVSRRAPVG